MRSPFQLIGESITRRPMAVAAIFILVFIIALYGMGQTTMETGRDTYIDKSTPRGALLDKYLDTFKSDSVMLLFECDNVLDTDVLRISTVTIRDRPRGVRRRNPERHRYGEAGERGRAPCI